MDDWDLAEYEIEQRAADKQRHLAEQFTEYVLEESGTTLTVEEWTVDAVADSLEELSHNGYQVEPEALTSDQWFVTVFAHPAVFDAIHQDAHEYIGREDSGEGVVVYTAKVLAAQTLPENTALAVHDNATAPSLPEDVHRPWLVKSSDGVIRLYNPREGPSDE